MKKRFHKLTKGAFSRSQVDVSSGSLLSLPPSTGQSRPATAPSNPVPNSTASSKSKISQQPSGDSTANETERNDAGIPPQTEAGSVLASPVLLLSPPDNLETPLPGPSQGPRSSPPVPEEAVYTVVPCEISDTSVADEGYQTLVDVSKDMNSGDSPQSMQPTGKPKEALTCGTGRDVTEACSRREEEGKLKAEIQIILEQLSKAAKKDPEKEELTYPGRSNQKVDVIQRITRLLRSVENYAKIVDVAIQHSPETTALIWAGARLILMLAINVIDFMEALEVTLATVTEIMATCEYYSRVYKGVLDKVSLDSDGTTQDLAYRVDNALKDLYTAVHVFVTRAKEHFERGNLSVRNFFIPFSQAAQPLIDSIRDKEKDLEKLAGMATMERIMVQEDNFTTLQTAVKDIQNDMRSLNKLDRIELLVEQTVGMMQDVGETVSNMHDEFRKFSSKAWHSVAPHQKELLFSTGSGWLSPEQRVHKLKTSYLQQSNARFESDLYVTTRGMQRRFALETEWFDLYERVKVFLVDDTTPSKLCLIQGSAGSGKSTFNHFLGRQLWKDYDNDLSTRPTEHLMSLNPIPIFITLASLYNPRNDGEDLIEKYFKEQNWTEEWINAARNNLRFVFLLDGYDEINVAQRHRNFYTDNKLGKWNAKVIVTSRPEYLTDGYQSQFYPSREEEELVEFWIAPFSQRDIELYIEKYLQARPSTASDVAPKYYRELIAIPEVRSLITNPFLLRMVVEVGPQFTKESETFNRVSLYEQFTRHWIEKALTRLNNIGLSEEHRKALIALCKRGFFTRKVKSFCQNFAIELYKHQILEVNYVPLDEDEFSAHGHGSSLDWGKYLGDDDQVVLKRFSSPILCNQDSYRYLHKSLRDFLVAQALWEQLSPDSHGLSKTIINEFRIIDDPGVVDFVIEYAERNASFRESLMMCVNASKNAEGVETAAANSITILVRAGHKFTECDLNHVRIPGADLRNGWFEKAAMRGANLTKVQLQGAWLRGADLKGSRMAELEFGEKLFDRLGEDPELWGEGTDVQSESFCGCLSFTPSGELLLALPLIKGMSNHGVGVVSIAQARVVLHCVLDHSGIVSDFTLSSDGTLLAYSMRYNCTVYLAPITDWGVSATARFGTVRPPSCLGISAKNKFLFAGNDDGTMYVWEIEAQNLVQRMSSHQQEQVKAMFMSPDNSTLTSVDRSGILSIWSIGNGHCMKSVNISSVWGGWGWLGPSTISFSPDGMFLVWPDLTTNNLILWSVPDNVLVHTFQGHSGYSQNLLFSPDSTILASTSYDSTLRLWSIEERQEINVIRFNSCLFGGLCFSHDGKYVAIYDNVDRLARQWMVISQGSRRYYGQTNQRSTEWHHFNNIKHISASMNVDCMALGIRSFDGISIAFCDFSITSSPFVQTIGFLELNASLFRVSAFALSPEGGLVAIGTDKRHDPIRLWSTESHECVSTLEAHTDYVYCITFSFDGRHIAWGGYDNRVRLWSLSDADLPGSMIYVFEGHFRGVHAITFSQDGSLIASGDSKGIVFIWSCLNFQKIYQMPTYTWAPLKSIEFSPDGTQLIMSSRSDMTLWAMNDSEDAHMDKVASLEVTDHTGAFYCKNGRIFVLGFKNGHLSFRCGKSGEFITEVYAGLPISKVSWGPSMKDDGGQLLYVLCEPRTIQCWNIRIGTRDDAKPCVEAVCQWVEPEWMLNVGGMETKGATGLDANHTELLLKKGAIMDSELDD